MNPETCASENGFCLTQIMCHIMIGSRIKDESNQTVLYNGFPMKGKLNIKFRLGVYTKGGR